MADFPHDKPQIPSDAQISRPNGGLDVPVAAVPAQNVRSKPPLFSRLWRKLRPRRAPSAHAMLPLLIKVYAGFSKVDGRIVEEDIDSSLGFLKAQFPETLYSELRTLYRDALKKPPELNEVAQELSGQLDNGEKILLGVQLYVLVSRARFQGQQLLAFYQFMTNLGVATEAIDIVYQLNASTGEGEAPSDPDMERPLESLFVAGCAPGDVVLPPLPDGYSLAAFRFGNLMLLKNVGELPVIARGRQVAKDEFCRLFEGQSVVLDEFVLDHADLDFYFNAKKDVSSTKLYLTCGNPDASGNSTPHIEKTVSRESHLEIQFGLGVQVRALRETPASVAGAPLHKGTVIEATLLDRITFDDSSEVGLDDLRRRARELGSSFDLLASRTEYLVSDDPSKLRHGDILLSEQAKNVGHVLLRIVCNYEDRVGTLEVLHADRLPVVDGIPIRESTTLRTDETISLGDGHYLRCDFADRTIEEEHTLVSTLEARDLSHRYGPRAPALDGISFTARRGEMVCVMGPSGCGKSTLLRTLAGHLSPQGGQVLLNGFSLYRHPEELRPLIAFIPHEEAFDPLLSVRENLATAAAIRVPQVSKKDRANRVGNKLNELGLFPMRNRLAGEPEDKFLSGGERKRLNLGMDMVASSDVFLIDEPTSGLSSKDSEHVLEIIRGLAYNKVVLVSIHQPSTKLFHLFDKALLLDRGGRLAFYGTTDDALDYFREAHEETLAPTTSDAEIRATTTDWRQPDSIFDVLESPLRDLGGDILYEEDRRGHSRPARRFTPEYWSNRFQAHRIVEEAETGSEAATVHTPTPAADPPSAAPARLPTPPTRRPRETRVTFRALLRRSFFSRLRNRSNLFTTLLEAPALAALVATVLRYSEDGNYTFASAFHIPAYLFLTLVVGMFLGLTNSADEIIRDRALLQRERNHGINPLSYTLSKFVTLAFFAILQCAIYLAVGNTILEIRGTELVHLGWMSLTSISGVAIGLFISSVVKDSKTALNWIPIILIPQIILGGALIKYEEMNQNLDFLFSIRRWATPTADGAPIGEAPAPPDELSVPLICQFMPLRWAYEASIIAQANHNPIALTQSELEEEIDTLIENEQLTSDQENELDTAKQALAVIAGLEAESSSALAGQLTTIQSQLKSGRFDPADYTGRLPDSTETPVSADDVYINQKVLDLVTKAEMERLDYRDERRRNVFFGTRKSLKFFPESNDEGDPFKKNTGVSTLELNAVVLILFIAAALLAVSLRLRHILQRVK